MQEINAAIALTLLVLVASLGFFFFQEGRITRYCNSIEPGRNFIEVRIQAEKEFHTFRLANGSELQVRPRGPFMEHTRCRIFFDRYRMTAEALLERI